MATKAERIQKLKDRAAAKLGRINDLPAVVKLRLAAEAKAAEAAKLEAEYLKEEADRNRREETRAKIILGAGLLLLHRRILSFVLRAISKVLTPRDGEWIERWCHNRKLDYRNPSPLDKHVDERITDFLVSAESNTVPSVFDPVGASLRRVIGGLNEGELGLLIPDLLARATEKDDHRVLEAWLLSLHIPHQDIAHGV